MFSAAAPTLGWPELLLRLVVAAVLGGAIGFERELRERGAGLRTHMLVSVGAALFTVVSAYGFRDFLVSGGADASVDPTRIAAGIVTGIGFLGAGAIIRHGFSIRGLTTAATLWLVAAIGLAAGAGYWTAALIATGGALVSLGPLRAVSRPLTRRLRPDTGLLLVQLPSGESPSGVVDAVERFGGRIHTIEVTQEADRRHLELTVEIGSAQEAPALVAVMADVRGVLEVRWEE